MDARTLKRLGLFLLVAALATGCAPLRGSRLFPLAPSATGDTMVPAESFGGGTIVSAGANGTAQPVVPAAGQQTPQPLQTVAAAPAPVPPAVPMPLAGPRPLPPTPAMPTATDPQLPPMMVPPVAPPGTRPGHPHHDPHVRTTPTAAGARLALAPHEMSTDRVVELTLYLERLLAQNRDLAARIKELEAGGIGREQALAEAMREVDSVTADAIKNRATLQAQVIGLQGKLKQLEEDDIYFLKLVIEALGRAFPEAKKP